MAARKASLQSLKSIAGATLLAFGIAILLANLDEIAATVSNFAGLSTQEGLSVLPALGLASLRALQAYAFNPSGISSALLQILVSFWPLVLVFAGVLVLRRAFGHRSKFSAPAGSSTAAAGDRCS